MAYCDLDDLKAKMGEEELISLTDDEDTGAVNTGVTDQMIVSAGALIDAYCARRYTVPFDPVPEMVKSVAVDIAAYKLFSKVGRAGDNIRNEYKDAVGFLKDVAAKKADIDGATIADTGKSSDQVVITTPGRVFSRAKMEGF